MTTVAFRVWVVVIAAAITSLAYLLAGWKDTWFGIQVTQEQAAWLAASVQIVLAIYKWGVGELSRYTPPPETDMKDRPLTVTAAGSSVSAHSTPPATKTPPEHS